MSDDEKRAASEQRLMVLAGAFDSDPDDHDSMLELNTARRRLSEQLARVITARPDLRRRLGGRVPEPDDGGPRTPEETMLWQVGVTYEHTAGLLRVYVGEERIHELPIVGLRGNASLN